jgi:diguanylate cyclase (GGDEF)-like protein
MGSTPEHRRGTLGALLVLLGLALCYPAAPAGLFQDVWYDAVGAACVALAGAGLRRHRPERPEAWRLVLAGYLGWVVGDVVSSAEQNWWHLTGYPLPSDAVYLCSYALLAVGLLRLVPRHRLGQGDVAVALDAMIVATGFAVIAGSFLLAPALRGSTLSDLGLVVTAAYPLADVVLVAVLVRLWLGSGVRSPALLLLCGANAVTLLADLVWQGSVLATTSGDSSTWNDVIWLLGYVLVAAACSSPSVARPGGPSSRPVGSTTRLQLVTLTVGMVLPGATLVVGGALGRPSVWQVVGPGSILLSLLALVRAAGLVRVVQEQAVQLAALARSDPLTGAPNRRTWDHELSRGCQSARDEDEPLSVAIIDLDLFKSYNDTHGHQAGDRLLREAVAAWTELLGRRDLLARYGGEEFAVLLPGRSASEAAARIEQLRGVTPHGQTFSAGVASWDPLEDPATVVNAADQALYRAKRAGRDRIHVVSDEAGRTVARPLAVVLQPIVDLRTGEPVGMEALARFEGEPTQLAFERAHRAGTGAELEAAAIRAAFAVRPRDLRMGFNVSLSLLTDPQITRAMPEDLTRVVIEITEDRDAPLDPLLDSVLADLRRRGAWIAVDDWGTGFSNLDRLLRLRPELLKLDISLVRGLDDDYHRAAIRSVVGWADEVGVRVCAEGVETEDQRAVLVALGVHHGQGYLFGRPAPPGTYGELAGVTPRTPAPPRLERGG